MLQTEYEETTALLFLNEATERVCWSWLYFRVHCVQTFFAVAEL